MYSIPLYFQYSTSVIWVACSQ